VADLIRRTERQGLAVLTEPIIKRAVAFFDGQNPFHCAKAAFGYTYPNYNPVALANAVCSQQKWRNEGVRFYTGVPDASDNPFWNHFWIAKGAQMGRQGVLSIRGLFATGTSRSDYLMELSTLFSTVMRRGSMFG
jgi:hypothetical protein